VVQGQRWDAKSQDKNKSMVMLSINSIIHHSIAVILQLVEHTVLHTDIVKVGKNLLHHLASAKTWK
jgi:hypothetical protein